jgi:transcriptional regulator GlxA family with amidase domain
MQRVYPTEANERHVSNLIRLAESQPHFGVKDLAAAINLSRARLEDLFKRQTGQQIGQYLLMLRLGKAARLLESTEMRVKEITFAVGYEHPSSFVRAFRKTYATSPGDYRKTQSWLAKDRAACQARSIE